MKFIFNFQRISILKTHYFLLLFVMLGSFGTAKSEIHKHILKNLSYNQAPSFSNSNYFYSVSEDAAPGTSAGNVSATDADGDQITYSIKSGNTNGVFSINSSTGSITIIKRLNHHTQDSFVLVVKAADPGSLSSQATVTIKITESSIIPGVSGLTWSNAANQPYTVNESQGEVVNGRLYTFGGFDSQKPSFTPTSRAYVFNPLANTWSSIAAMPPMNGTNYGGVTHAGFTTDGTDIYFAGGYTSNSTGTGQKFGTNEVWKYIVAENRYVRLPNLPIVLAAGQLEYLGGKLHHISGTNAARTVDLSDHYVLTLDSLSAGWKKAAPLPNPRQHAGSVVFEKKIYFMGGQHGQDENLVAQKEVHVYDPRYNTWTKVADLPVPAGTSGRGHISSAAIVVGKYILVLAGETVHGSGRTNMVSAYNASNNTWQNLTPLPQTRYSGVAANLGGVIYYTGGSKTNITYKGTSSSSPATQSIQSFTLMNAEKDEVIKTIVNGETLNLATLPSTQLNIVANTNPSSVGSVQFILSGTENTTVTESSAPYSVFGDDGNGNYNSWTPQAGNYTLKGTPYTSSGAQGTAGTSLTVSFSVVNNAVENFTLTPTADATVRSGTYGNTNYGTDNSLLIKGSPSAEYTRSDYLKFSLGNVTNITTATLRLYGHVTSTTSGIPISVYGVNSDSWTETGITFNNAPVSFSSLLNSKNVSNVSKYYEFDVTSFVKTQAAGDKIVTLFIKDLQKSDLNVAFNSRENSQNRPQLFITTGAQAANRSSDLLSSLSEKTITIPNATIGNISTKVYPNPVHRTFNVEFPKEFKGGYDLQMVDPVGRMYKLPGSSVKAGISAKIMEVDVSKLSLKPGIYFLRILSGSKQIEMIKLIVQ